MSNYLESLNDPQRDAVATIDGPVLVLAGAGTGKTRVLTTRIVHILESGKALPSEILAVTFTNKAAREMKQRIEDMIGPSAAGLMMGTFHSLCARIMRKHAEVVGLQTDFTILDSDDQQRVMTEIMTEQNVDTSRWPPRQVVGLISKWKDEAKTPDKLTNDDATAFHGKGKSLYEAYQRRLIALNAADFGDLLLHTLTVFNREPEILTRYQQQFKYILVDEYQDTNAVQYLWLRMLAMGYKNICVVGDDDQSIYAWRGAQVGNILKFEEHFPGAKVVRLEQNYRSTANILNAAAGLIKNNSERHKKTLWTAGDNGEKIEVQPCMDDYEESRMIADAIERNAGNAVPYEYHAVLVRTAAQTRSVEESFLKNGIPYQVIGGLRFYERKEIRDALAYLKLVHSPQHDLAFERIINVPKRGLGASSLQAIKDLSRELSISQFEAAELAVNEGRLTGAISNKLRPFVENIHFWQQQMPNSSPDELLEQILEQSGYLDMLRNDKDPAAKTRLENLKELVRAVQEYPDLMSFLEHVSLVMDRDEDQPDTVKLMTVHAAKGLEFDTVFIPGFEEGLFPHQRSLNEEGTKGLEEERRLAYVAITRAKRRLVISYAGSRRLYGSFTPSVASRFLNELPQDCLSTKPATGSASYYRPRPGSTYEQNWQGTGYGKKPTPLLKTQAEARPTDPDNPFSVGSRVFHQKFGYGRIAGVEGKGTSQRFTINFDKAGRKNLVASLAKLEAV